LGVCVVAGVQDTVSLSCYSYKQFCKDIQEIMDYKPPRGYVVLGKCDKELVEKHGLFKGLKIYYTDKLSEK